MEEQMTDRCAALTEKEKQTLRLIVRGHDAKSTARHLGLSVHTINERLRDARRKLAVSSSREAARMLFDRETGAPEYSADKQIGEARPIAGMEQLVMPENGAGRKRLAWILFGVALMSLVLALAAISSLPPAMLASADSSPSVAAQAAEVEGAARRFLTLLDQGKWDESYKLTTASFQKVNTGKVWAEVSEQVRPPLGAMISRTMISHDDVPTPPHGYDVVKFRTNFANKANAIEKVSLERDGNGWRVAGVTIE
jgi:DNA-binding CsgD family transcriptional regulator